MPRIDTGWLKRLCAELEVPAWLRKSWTWVSSNPIPAITVVGVLFYGLLRLEYSDFYGHFRLSPEEVGLGYSDILARSAMGTVAAAAGIFVVAVGALVVLLAVAFSYYFLVVDFLPIVILGLLSSLAWPFRGSSKRVHEVLIEAGTAVRDIRERSMQLPARAARRLLRGALLLNLLVALFLAALGYVLMRQIPTALHSRVEQVINGENADPVNVLRIPVLGVQANHVEVVPTSRDSIASSLLRGRSCLLLLGDADATTVLYDADAHEIVRIPSSAVLLRVSQHQICRTVRFEVIPTVVRRGESFSVFIPSSDLPLPCWTYRVAFHPKGVFVNRVVGFGGSALELPYTAHVSGTFAVGMRLLDRCTGKTSMEATRTIRVT